MTNYKEKMKNSSCHTFFNLLDVCLIKINVLIQHFKIYITNNTKKDLALFQIEKQQPMPLFLKRSCRYMFLSQYYSIT